MRVGSTLHDLTEGPVFENAGKDRRLAGSADQVVGDTSRLDPVDRDDRDVDGGQQGA